MPEPRNPEEYIRLVDEAIFEVEELVRCAEDEEDGAMEFSRLVPEYRRMIVDLKSLRMEVEAGTHTFGTGADLPFMETVKNNRALVPIAPLLEMLNSFHRAGFQGDGSGRVHVR
jgi:hypothetical protein